MAELECNLDLPVNLTTNSQRALHFKSGFLVCLGEQAREGKQLLCCPAFIQQIVTKHHIVIGIYTADAL